MNRSFYIVFISVVFISLPVHGQPPAVFALEEASLSTISDAFDAGVLTSERLVELYLNRIDAYDQQGPALNSIITINDSALAIAKALDEERLATGKRSVLHGIPILLKDNFDTFDMPTSGGTEALRNSIPPDDAFVVQRLREAGAIILGKTNLAELAAANEPVSTILGRTRNPFDLRRSPGVSSSGTGAAISANFAVLGTGTDTGGSIRIPSSWSGLVGIKPTLGLTSRDGVIPLTLTRDVTGPMTRTVSDAAMMLDFMVGVDPNDEATSASDGHIPDSYVDSLNVDGLQGARIGVIPQLIKGQNVDSRVTSISEVALEIMRSLGAQVIELPQAGDLVRLLNSNLVNLYLFNTFEYDMNRYLESLGPDAPVKTTQELIGTGRHHSSLDFFPFANLRGDIPPEADPRFRAITDTEESLRAGVLDLLESNNLDAIVYPTTTVPANPEGDTIAGRDVNTFLGSFTRLPALTVPGGYVDGELPVGIEFLGRPFSEPSLISLGFAFEQETQHRKPSSLFPPLAGETILGIAMPGDFDRNGKIDVRDIDLLAVAIRGNESASRFDLDNSGSLGRDDLTYMVEEIIGSWFGDANLDGEFNSGDLVELFAAAEYEDDVPLNSTWATGDFNGDGDFESGDLVTAFDHAGYEKGPRAALNVVPEPSAVILTTIAMIGLACRRHADAI